MRMSKDGAKGPRRLPKPAEAPKAKTGRKTAVPEAPAEEKPEAAAPPARPKTVRRVAAAPEARKPAPEPAKPKAAGVLAPGKESLLLTAKGDLGAQEMVAGEEGSRIYCFCGKEIVLAEDAANRILRCTECGLSFRVILAVEPRTKKQMAITLPRAGPPAK